MLRLYIFFADVLGVDITSKLKNSQFTYLGFAEKFVNFDT